MKEISNVKIAINHASHVIFTIIIIRFFLVKNLLVEFFGAKDTLIFIVSPLGELFNYALIFFSIILGIIISKERLSKQCIIKNDNKNEVIKLSAIVFIIELFIVNFFSIIISGVIIGFNFDIIKMIIDIILIAIIFYLLSKKIMKSVVKNN